MKFIDKSYAGPLEKIISGVVCLLLLPVILLNINMIVKSYVQPDQMPSVFGVTPVVVLTGSMEPTFGPNSLIFIKERDPATLKEGEIICYLENGTTAVTHRIHEIVMTDGVASFITKGDANNTVDRMSVSPDQIQGVYTGHWKGAGGFVMFMQTPAGIALFIAVPMLAYFVADYFLTRKERRNDKQRNKELEKELEALKMKIDN